jgi:hypothetical protein
MLNKTNLPPEQDPSAHGKLEPGQAVGHAAGSSTAVGVSNVIAFPAPNRRPVVHEDFTFVELPPGRHAGTVEKVRYSFRAATQIVITYRLDTPAGVCRVEERLPIKAPKSSASAFDTTKGLGRVEEVLRIRGLTLADVRVAAEND